MESWIILEWGNAYEAQVQSVTTTGAGRWGWYCIHLHHLKVVDVRIGRSQEYK